MKMLCRIGFHAWIKWGGTRVTGLFRQCSRCSRLQEGVEGRRRIHWIEGDDDSRFRAALARVGGAA